MKRVQFVRRAWAVFATAVLVKSYLSQGAGRVYHVPGGRFYEEASPERCYASEDEARRDGSVPARDPRLVPGSRDVVSARSPDPRGCPTRSTTRRSS